jgi:hypothetical protein
MSQQLAHDLAAARLRQHVGEADVRRPRQLADLLLTCSISLPLSFSSGFSRH